MPCKKWPRRERICKILPEKGVFSHSCTPDTTLDYKHRKISLYKLFGGSIVLILEKNWIFILF